MFFKKDNSIELAMKRHLEDQRKIATLEKRLTLLLNKKSIAREVVELFVDNDNYSNAIRWLEGKGL